SESNTGPARRQRARARVMQFIASSRRFVPRSLLPMECLCRPLPEYPAYSARKVRLNLIVSNGNDCKYPFAVRGDLIAFARPSSPPPYPSAAPAERQGDQSSGFIRARAEHHFARHSGGRDGIYVEKSSRAFKTFRFSGGKNGIV